MSKRQVIMLLGVVVIFLPFLGFTSAWNTMISVVCGLLIIAIAYGLSPIVKQGNVIGKASSDNGSVIQKSDPTIKSSALPFVDHHSSQEPVITEIK